MEVKFLVLAEGGRVQTGKNGTKNVYEVSLRDESPGERCLNNFSLALEGEDVDKYKGKLRDNRVMVAIKRMMPNFNGDLRIDGRILSLVNGSGSAKSA